MTKRTDFEGLFPDPAKMKKAMASRAPSMMVCPTGHMLPHRTPWGRCAAVDCCDIGEPGTRGAFSPAEAMKISREGANVKPYEAEMALLPRGQEHLALKRGNRSIEEAEQAAAQNEQAIEFHRRLGQRYAKEALHTFPKIPAPPNPEGLTPKQYVQQRLEQVSPYLIEDEIFAMMYGTAEEKREARAALLDRSGHGRKPEAAPVNTQPVLIVNIGGGNPYEKQIHNAAPTQGAVPHVGNVPEHLTVVAVPGFPEDRALLIGDAPDYAGLNSVVAGSVGAPGQPAGVPEDVQPAGDGIQEEGDGDPGEGIS